jgi:hypothetical protein
MEKIQETKNEKDNDTVYFTGEIVKLRRLIKRWNISEFTQSQSHGLYWDNEIRQRVFGLKNECKNDTKKYDIDCLENKFDKNENISIKTSGNNSIDCGDILRFYNGDFDKKYTIILLRYRQIGDMKKIYQIMEINYSKKLRDILFGSISYTELEKYVDFIKSIPSGKPDKRIKTQYKNMKQELQEKYNMKCNISPKVDSKSQRRVQCSIPNIDKLFVEYPQFVLSKSDKSIVRGIEIKCSIKSQKRLRNKNK